MYELALFAGAGGGLLATQHLLEWRTVCYVENNEYCVGVLEARIRDGLLDDAPIWGDVKEFDGRPWRGVVDIVSAGFPCQPFSKAGKRRAEMDGRNLWPDTARIIDEVRPRFVLLENVPALRCPVRRDGCRIPAYFGRVLGDLAESGYDARWDCIPASAVGAPHQRDRLWIVAYTDAYGGGLEKYEVLDGSQVGRESESEALGHIGGFCDQVAYAGGDGLEEQSGDKPRLCFAGGSWWKAEPGLDRVVDGMAGRVDRLEAIGNGQVPAVVARVWQLLGGAR